MDVYLIIVVLVAAVVGLVYIPFFLECDEDDDFNDDGWRK